MLLESLTFFCDTPECPQTFTTYRTSDQQVDAYVDLFHHGWGVGRDIKMLSTTRNHYCPEHRPD